MNHLLYTNLALYLVASILYLLQWVFVQSRLAKIANQTTWVAWLLHTGILGIAFYKTGYPFLANSELSYSFSAWVTALLFLLLNWKYRYQLVGSLMLPLISVFYLLSLFSSQDYAQKVTLLKSPWASVHIVFSFLALGLFSISFVLGIIFIIEEFQVKHKVLPKLFLKFPSLDSLEQIHAKALTVGFILLTGAIITGAGWAKRVTGAYFFEDPRQLWAICAWLIYALFLQARFAAGWRGRKGVLLSLLGFAVIMFTFLGVDHS